MINGKSGGVTLLLLLLDVSNHEIERAITEGTFFEIPIKLTSVHCRTPPVERINKLVTAASSIVCGHQNKYGYLRSTLQWSKLLPKFENKTQLWVRKTTSL